MSPLFDRESINSLGSDRKINPRKFVRSGENIAYNTDTLQHNRIAQDHFLGQPIDDAGMIFLGFDEILVKGKSISLDIPYLATERERTVEILASMAEGDIEVFT